MRKLSCRMQSFGARNPSFLYDPNWELSTQGELRDTVRSYVGMRKVQHRPR